MTWQAAVDPNVPSHSKGAAYHGNLSARHRKKLRRRRIAAASRPCYRCHKKRKVCIGQRGRPCTQCRTAKEGRCNWGKRGEREGESDDGHIADDESGRFIPSVPFYQGYTLQQRIYIGCLGKSFAVPGEVAPISALPRALTKGHATAPSKFCELQREGWLCPEDEASAQEELEWDGWMANFEDPDRALDVPQTELMEEDDDNDDGASNASSASTTSQAASSVAAGPSRSAKEGPQRLAGRRRGGGGDGRSARPPLAVAAQEVGLLHTRARAPVTASAPAHHALSSSSSTGKSSNIRPHFLAQQASGRRLPASSFAPGAPLLRPRQPLPPPPPAT